ncbi:beta strand repeat-containing protein [Brevibacillus ginsengisoli]|uniref:beta strand repeat-containing protein n=1 Tax=Brevibacillus ginsengisoli TaxID=363854 RepID=UPI003CEAF4BB
MNPFRSFEEKRGKILKVLIKKCISFVALFMILFAYLVPYVKADQVIQDFESGTSSQNNFIFLDGTMYSSDITGQLIVDTFANGAQLFWSSSACKNKCLIIDSLLYGNGYGTTFRFNKSNSSNFKLTSFNAEVLGHQLEYSQIYKLIGYDDQGVPKATATVDFTNGTKDFGEGNSTVSYTRLSTSDETNNGGNGGSLTFTGSNWSNINVFEMRVDDPDNNRKLFVAIDDLIMDDPVVPKYTLNYVAGANGTITGTASQTVNSGGNGTTVIAVPNPGYQFVKWSDDVTTASRTDTNVTANKIVTASFAINKYTLDYAAGANGTITGTASQTVNHGGNGTTVTAVPNAGYRFDGWSDGVTTASRTDTNVTANKIVTANFAVNTYTLSYAAGANGTITGIASQTVNPGGSGTTVTAVPNVGYHFDGWSDGVTTANRTDTNVTANKSVTANFAINTYTLNYQARPNGKITGAEGQIVNHGGSGTTVTAVPNPGYHFESWSDGSTTASRTETNVTTDLFYFATFAINEYTLNYAAGANGTITGTAAQTVNYGGSGTTVTAVPNAGYHFVNWSDGVTTASRTDANIAANLSVTANFAIKTYTLNYQARPNGKITGAEGQIVNHGGSGTTVTAVPNAGYHFESWSDGSTTASRTETNVTTDLFYFATFAINEYTLNYASGANGTITGTADQMVNYGGSGTEVTAVPDAGYHFVSWNDGVTTASRTDANVTTNLSATANFAMNTYTLDYTAGANGTITGTASQTVNHGESGTEVTAEPNPGYHFVSWSDGLTTASRTDKNVTANLSVTAILAINEYTLDYVAASNGTITGTASQAVNHGESGTEVTATPDTGYHFVSWSDGVTTASRTDANVTTNLSVTATFAMNTYTLEYAAGANGTITGIAPQTVNHGESGTEVTAVPDTGYHFVSWNDGVKTASRTDKNVASNLSVTANFAMNTYTLDYAAGANGRITGTASQKVNHGESGTEVTAIPDTEYHFVSWSDGVTTASRTDKDVTSDLNVTAKFAINEHTLDYVAGANGTITGTASQTVNHGESGTEVTATPNTGYHFEGWSDGVTTASRKDSNVTANLSVTANFAKNTYTLDYSAGDNGAITGTASQTVNHGESGTEVTAIPDTGYHFVSWSDGVTTASRTDKNVAANLNVTANFAINTYTADLNNLTLSQGTLTPAFVKGTTTYTATVPNAVTSTDVTPTTEEGSATLTMNGSPVTSGKSETISLRVGSNPITMVVTAPDGKIKTYTITVERRAATPPPYYPPQVIPVTGVSLDQNNVTLQVGATGVGLHATITPANATNRQVKWSSGDSGVATVDQNGVITAVAAGETTISVSTLDGNYSASCSVKVGEEKQFELKASERRVRLKPNKSMKFEVYAVYSDGKEVNITSDKNTTYSSSSSVVTVKPGTIKAGKKEGAATVTVSFEGQTTEIAVKVSKAEVKELVLPTDHLTLVVQATKQLQATAKLSNGTTEEVTQDALWSSDDPDVVRIEAGKLTAVTPGKATITVSYSGKEAKLKVDVTDEKELKRLAVNRSQVKLAPGKQQQIKLTAYYQDQTKAVVTDKAEWTTSDEQIATVKEGMITAVAPGTATIQASYKGKKVTIKVTVLK